ncbi:hypothetical protein OV208_40055 [Corallococcus sp. bb12-1]|uniref:hypothetical protein n=1 Tax=Corallococcus sp. bb12-1 TaxID=2996784 RepID=UPI00227031D4|nr:hypothetical protein [Corallococcus sp. bb12-1]MCY1047562.1 hypothetical protein [Corallococcus sp. bb12-1]
MIWKRITRAGKPIPKGLDPRYPELLVVQVNLSETPPPEWQKYFLDSVNVPFTSNQRNHELFGTEVTLYPRDHELEAYVRNVDERIQASNTLYEQVNLPRVLAEEERRKREEAEQKRRLDEARERASKL